MAVTTFQDLPLADRDLDWDGDAAEKRVREWAGADDYVKMGDEAPWNRD